MEKKIEKMKKEMNGQIRFYSALSLLGLFTVCLLSSGTLTALYTDSHIADFVHGFLIGLIIVVEVYSILQISKNMHALKDETTLKRLYHKLHDERTQQIEALSGQKSLQATILLSIVAGILVCRFSFEAFLGMLGVVFIAGITRKCYKIYYNHTYTGE